MLKLYIKTDLEISFDCGNHYPLFPGFYLAPVRFSVVQWFQIHGQSMMEHLDVEPILSHYDLGGLEQVEALAAGTVQTNLLLHTARMI